MQIAILTLDGFNELDSFIAAGILNRMKSQGWTAHITCPTPQVTSMAGVTIRRQKPLEFLADADAVLARIEANGVRVDADELRRQSTDLSKRMLAAQQKATELAGRTFNLDSPKQLGALLFDELKLPAVVKTPKGQPSTNEEALEAIAGPYGIGRGIHLGDTIIGIKGRVGFEAAAPMVILKSHHALEKHVLTKWQLQWKDTLSQFYGNWLHEGQILDPVMRDIEAYLNNSQAQVTGEVFIQLHPYRFQIIGIESANDLMSAKFGKYGEMNTGWTGADVRGFTKIFGNQTAIFHHVKEENKK